MARFGALVLLWLTVGAVQAEVPVVVTPLLGKQGMVVAGHPEAAAAGLAILQAGGNALDAAVATSLALGVAEPYGSGLGGKLMLLYYDAKSGRTTAVDAMDAAGSVAVAAFLRLSPEARTYGYGSVCVPGLAAGLWAAHRRWGSKPWADVVQPAIALARSGFLILPKTRDQFEEQEPRLRRGDAEIARLYLVNGALPEVGSRLPNADLARTLEALAREGRDGFYRGSVARAIVAAAQRGGGWLTPADLEHYEARFTEPVTMEFRGCTIASGPPPTSGAALFLPILKALESDSLAGDVLRSPANLDTVGRVWRAALPNVAKAIGDAPESFTLLEKLLAPAAIAELRAKALGPPQTRRKVVSFESGAERPPHYESAMAATTHFVVADRDGNIVSATQSQSVHFGAGVVPPGTGVVMNNSMSNFTTTEPRSLNYIAPGRRPRSTIGPTIVWRAGRPVLAVGIPGDARIPTGLLQVLLDRLLFNRSLTEAIGDTRIHFQAALRAGGADTVEAEGSLPAADVAALAKRGWNVVLREPAGTGRHFGGVNAIEWRADGTLAGYADPRRTNAAAGY